MEGVANGTEQETSGEEKLVDGANGPATPSKRKAAVPAEGEGQGRRVKSSREPAEQPKTTLASSPAEAAESAYRCHWVVIQN